MAASAASPNPTPSTTPRGKVATAIFEMKTPCRFPPHQIRDHLQIAFEDDKYNLEDAKVADIYTPLFVIVSKGIPGALDWYLTKKKKPNLRLDSKSQSYSILDYSVSFVSHTRYTEKAKEFAGRYILNDAEKIIADREACLLWVLAQIEKQTDKSNLDDHLKIYVDALRIAVPEGNLLYVTYFFSFLLKKYADKFSKDLRFLDFFWRKNLMAGNIQQNSHTVVEMLKYALEDPSISFGTNSVHFNHATFHGREDILESLCNLKVKFPQKELPSTNVDNATFSNLFRFHDTESKKPDNKDVLQKTLRMKSTLQTRAGAQWYACNFQEAINLKIDLRLLMICFEEYKLTNPDFNCDYELIKGEKRCTILAYALFKQHNEFARTLIKQGFYERECKEGIDRDARKCLNSLLTASKFSPIDIVKDLLARSMKYLFSNPNHIDVCISNAKERQDDSKESVLAYLTTVQTIIQHPTANHSEALSKHSIETDRKDLEKIARKAALYKTKMWPQPVVSEAKIEASAPPLDVQKDVKDHKSIGAPAAPTVAASPPGGISAALAPVADPLPLSVLPAASLVALVARENTKRYSAEENLQLADEDAPLKKLLASRELEVKSANGKLSQALIDDYVEAFHTAVACGNLYYVTYYLHYLMVAYRDQFPLDLNVLDVLSCSDKLSDRANLVTITEVVTHAKTKEISLCSDRPGIFYIHSAAFIGREDLVSVFLKYIEDPEEPNLQNPQEMSALACAIYFYKQSNDTDTAIKMIDSLLQGGAAWHEDDLLLATSWKISIVFFKKIFSNYNLFNSKIVCNENRSLLATALSNDHDDFAKHLIELGMVEKEWKVIHKDKFPTSIRLACREDRIEILKNIFHLCLNFLSNQPAVLVTLMSIAQGNRVTAYLRAFHHFQLMRSFTKKELNAYHDLLSSIQNPIDREDMRKLIAKDLQLELVPVAVVQPTSPVIVEVVAGDQGAPKPTEAPLPLAADQKQLPANIVEIPNGVLVTPAAHVLGANPVLGDEKSEITPLVEHKSSAAPVYQPTPMRAASFSAATANLMLGQSGATPLAATSASAAALKPAQPTVVIVNPSTTNSALQNHGMFGSAGSGVVAIKDPQISVQIEALKTILLGTFVTTNIDVYQGDEMQRLSTRCEMLRRLCVLSVNFPHHNDEILEVQTLFAARNRPTLQIDEQIEGRTAEPPKPGTS